MRTIYSTIKDIYSSKLLFCSPDTEIADAALLMLKSGTSSIIIKESGIPIGIWTENDCLKIDVNDPNSVRTPIRKHMRYPIKTVNHDITVGAAILRFKEEKVRHFVVVDHTGKAVGILTQGDIIKKTQDDIFLETYPIKRALSVSAPIVKSDMDINEALKYMRTTKQRAVCVDYGNTEFGILTERDVARFVSQQKFPKTVGEGASRPLSMISNQSNLLEAKQTLLRTGFRHLGVVNRDGKIDGLISYGGILSSLQYKYVQIINATLEEKGKALKQTQTDLNIAQKIIDSSLDGIIITDPKGNIQYVNPAFTSVTQFSAEEVIGHNPSLLQSGKHDEAFYQNMWAAIKTNGYWQGEIWNKRKNGETYPEWLTITAIHGENGQVLNLAGIFCDISERKAQEAEIRRLAYYDELTKLPNRRMFNDRLTMALARAKRHNEELAVLFVDLDRFKKVNDIFGHSIGDDLLVEAARRINSCTREEDTVARLGGDEFVILLNNVDSIEETTRIASRVIHEFSLPFKHGKEDLFVTASIGISLFPIDGESSESLLKNADIAMYRAKKSGRSTFSIFNPDYEKMGIRQLEIENNLRTSISKNEFQLYFQPMVCAQTQEVVAAEALLRWTNANLGSVSPVEFIPIAEENGLISEIGCWVLNQACQYIKKWRDQNYRPISVAINIAPEQISSPDFPDLVQSTLSAYDLPGDCLKIEITEGSFISDAEHVSRNIFALKKIGVCISIDDFGTGYSNLAYLHQLPIDFLKIDKSFVSSLFNGKGNADLVCTIIDMSKNLNVQSVAEGVETQEQADFLSAKGCSILQGYLLSKPEPADVFERHIKA